MAIGFCNAFQRISKDVIRELYQRFANLLELISEFINALIRFESKIMKDNIRNRLNKECLGFIQEVLDENKVDKRVIENIDKNTQENVEMITKKVTPPKIDVNEKVEEVKKSSAKTSDSSSVGDKVEHLKQIIDRKFKKLSSASQPEKRMLLGKFFNLLDDFGNPKLELSVFIDKLCNLVKEDSDNRIVIYSKKIRDSILAIFEEAVKASSSNKIVNRLIKNKLTKCEDLINIAKREEAVKRTRSAGSDNLDIKSVLQEAEELNEQVKIFLKDHQVQ